MNIERLAQQVKELRKEKCLSQEELAKLSGVSLRTVQRVEKEETVPSGETLKRILNALGTSYENLFQNSQTNPLKRTLKGHTEYLHIFDDSLVINNSFDPDVMRSYRKTLHLTSIKLSILWMIFFVLSIVAIILYFFNYLSLSIYIWGLPLMVLFLIFYVTIYLSSVPYIKRKNIIEMNFLQQGLGIIHLIIVYKEDKKIRERNVAFHTRDFEFVKEGLLLEGLPIEEKISREYSHFIFLVAMSAIYWIGRNQDYENYVYFYPILSVLYVVYIGIKLFYKSSSYRKYLVN